MRSHMNVIAGLLLLASPAFAGGTLNAPPGATGYKIKPLVADQMGVAPNFDPNLINPWGLSQDPGGELWVSDNGTNLSTIYDRKKGTVQSLVVTIPLGAPTGQVAPPSGTGFDVTENGKSGGSDFVFDTETGAIEGWSPSVDLNNAVVAVDNSAKGSSYKGLAYDPTTNTLFATDFVNNQVQVYDSSFNLINTFTDTNLPKRYAPFGVAVFNGNVYVTFAERKTHGIDEVDGPGLGYVDVFTTAGTLVKQLIAKGPLNAPWGITIAPKKFGTFAGDLLIANFGDGWINAFDPSSGAYLGALSDSKGNPLAIAGLWALDNGPGMNEVTFSAGPDKESHGLVGLIVAGK